MTVNIIDKEEESNLLHNSFLAWQNIKAKYMDAIILVRHEEEYYTFESDAEKLQLVLGIEPEKQDEKRPICHVPHYYTDWLLPKLVKAGYRIALCEPLYFNVNL